MSYETDRNQVLGAIENIAQEHSIGLCRASRRWSRSQKRYDRLRDLVIPYLEHLGAKPGTVWKWPSEPDDRDARNQRLMFLAFMLTWLDDAHGVEE